MATKKVVFKKNLFPTGLYVYKLPDDDDDVYYCAVESLDDIPEDLNGEVIGCYKLNDTLRFTVKRGLEDVE